jgi:biotin transport system substrate-specific component
MSAVADTIRSRAWTKAATSRRVTRGIGIAFFVLGTWFGASVAVPMPWTQVPMSLQPLFVLLAGALLGPRAGAAAMAAYLALGASGAPVFALGGAGLPWLMGPTGGYLLAMPVAAWIVGSIGGRDPGTARQLLALTAGMCALYLGGVTQLLLVTGLDLGSVAALGVLPFLAGDVIKILAALLLARSVRSKSLGH